MVRILLLLLPAATAVAAPVFQTDLFQRGDAGVHTYRIPALVETAKGTLIAVVDARHDSPRDLPARISLAMRRSFDRGRTWTPAQTIRNVKDGGAGDPSLLLDRATGRVWCFHAYGPPGIGWATAKPGAVTGPDTFQFHAMYSDDDGATWSAPVDITPQVKDRSWQAMFATSGTHIQTASGRFLVPLVVRHGDGTVSSRNAYSDDHGKIWKAGAAIGPGTDESHSVELPGGVILQNMRNGNRRAIARSPDGGISFGPVSHDPALVDPGCNAGIARGRGYLVFTNAASTRRERMTVKLSRDGGLTWREAKVLHPGPAAYSTVVVLRDGSIAVLYECGDNDPYEKITFASFEP